MMILVTYACEDGAHARSAATAASADLRDTLPIVVDIVEAILSLGDRNSVAVRHGLRGWLTSAGMPVRNPVTLGAGNGQVPPRQPAEIFRNEVPSAQRRGSPACRKSPARRVHRRL